jgi:putative mRNA 3-end processing factor
MSFFSKPLVALTERGLFCEAGGFYVDPHRVVETAIVTHAHSDHARRGSARYLTVNSGIGVLRERIGKNIQAQGFAYGETFQMGRTKVSFHSSGHILGSAQVRIECDGEVWLCSGDYKRDPDPSCEPFESVKCDTFITEATFGTPKFAWPKDRNHGADIAAWWEEMSAQGKNAVIFGYSLGKAQRILAELAPYAKKPVLIYHTVVGISDRYREEGITLAPTRELMNALEELNPIESQNLEERTQGDLFQQGTGDCTPVLGVLDSNIRAKGVLRGELIIAPPSIFDEKFASRLGRYETAFASGWMQTQSAHGNGRYDRGVVMSDHADWNDLNRTILETGAKRVFVQHRNGTLIRHLRKQGIDAHSDDALKPEEYARLGGIPQSLW